MDLYLQDLTQEEIASKTGLSQQRIAQITNKFKNEEISKINLIPDSLQLYNIQSFPKLNNKYGLKGTTGQILGHKITQKTNSFLLSSITSWERKRMCS